MTIFDHLGSPDPLSKSDFDAAVAELRVELLQLQERLKSADFSVVLVISGVNAGGKGEVIATLNEWLDPRFIDTTAFDHPSAEERERPYFWRFWRALPPFGRIGIFVGSWYSEPIARQIGKKLKKSSSVRAMVHINQIEKELVADGTLVLKFWLHLSKDDQVARFELLKSDPITSWRVTKREIAGLETHARLCKVAEQVILATDTEYAHWTILNGADRQRCALTVGRHLRDAIGVRLDDGDPREGRNHGPPALPDIADALATIDLDASLSKSEYEAELAKYQGALNQLQHEAYERGISSVLVFEGWDAAGKGGAIRRIARAIDPRQYQIISIAAPSEEERRHHYLWRFWRHIPRAGKMILYDRSWYGRVLVERVEAFAEKHDWRRGYDEINDFEEELADHGICILKFWVHISADEQLQRFKDREQIPYKQYKITEEDYRNRERWHLYVDAANEMVARTDTSWAPWYLIAGNNKRHARVNILRTVCDTLSARLKD